MKKKLIRLAAMLAALCTVPAAMPVSADYIITPEGTAVILRDNPDVWTDPVSGAVYYTNWNLPERIRTLYETDGTSSARIMATVPAADTDENALKAACDAIFDDSYQTAILETQYYNFLKPDTDTAIPAWSIQITDSADRAETEAKADQLYASLSSSCTLLTYELQLHNHDFRHYADIQTLCTYFYVPADPSRGTGDPETGERLSALIAEQFPEWEVRTAETEQQTTWSVRKKGTEDFFDAPAAEYLAIHTTVQRELGYHEKTLTFYPEGLTVTEQVKYYIPGTGDLSEDGEITVADAVLLSRVIAEDEEVQVTEAGLHEADVNCDGILSAQDVRTVTGWLANPTA